MKHGKKYLEAVSYTHLSDYETASAGISGCFADSRISDAGRGSDGESGNDDIGRQLLRIGVFRRNMADGRCEVSGRYPALRF